MSERRFYVNTCSFKNSILYNLIALTGGIIHRAKTVLRLRDKILPVLFVLNEELFCLVVVELVAVIILKL